MWSSRSSHSCWVKTFLCGNCRSPLLLQATPHPRSVTKPKKCIDLPGCTLVQSYLGLLLWPFKEGGGYMLFNSPSKIILKTPCDFCVQGWGLDTKGFYTSPRCPHFPAEDLFRVTFLKTAHGGPWARLISPGTLRRESHKPHPQPMKPEFTF